MNLADRIQRLRKTKGISQEEMAGQLGVSRQAVSKWESGQSVPDLNKIIAMSEYFEVTTDYLLKGTEIQIEQSVVDARLFQIIATAFHAMGLFVSAAVWYEEQKVMAIVIWLIFLIVGALVLGIGFLYADQDSVVRAKRGFWKWNIWLISFVPLSIVYNIIFVGILAPYPLAVNPIAAYFAF